MERKEETKKVKDALKAAGINARVGHGKGTAWGWLHINVGSGSQYGDHVKDDIRNSHRNCIRCQKIGEIADKVEAIALRITGRTGEYGGCILIEKQKDWSQKNHAEVEIIQPN